MDHFKNEMSTIEDAGASVLAMVVIAGHGMTRVPVCVVPHVTIIVATAAVDAIRTVDATTTVDAITTVDATRPGPWTRPRKGSRATQFP